jgi:hypothetical protein
MYRWAGVGVVALALAGSGLKWWLEERAQQQPGATQGGIVSAGRAGSGATDSQPSAIGARARLDVSPRPGKSAPPLSARALRMQADWCGFGAAESSREEQALTTGKGQDRPADLAALAQTDGQQVLALARKDVLRQWVQALRRRGDLRSVALAEYLGTGDDASPDELAGNRARLQALASTSTDPMVTVLALRRPCKLGACRNIEASQWSRLEPENLQAWLTLAGTPGHSPDYLLERMAAVGRYSSSYQQEAGILLLSLLKANAPGLENQVESDLLTGVLAAWAIPPFAPLTAACRNPRKDATTASRCEAVAAAFWSGGNLLDRTIALSVAGNVVPNGASQRVVWEGRAREYEAVRFYEDDRVGRMSAELPSDTTSAWTCDVLPIARKWAREFAERSDWDRARAELQTNGADLNELARQWRQTQGRSALERPRQTAPAASAPG